MIPSRIFRSRFGRHKARTGFSLTELAIVLGIVGIVISAIWVYGSSAWDNYNVETVVGQVTKSADNIRDHYNGIQTWSQAAGTDVTMAFDLLNLFPLEMRANPKAPGATTLNHALGTSATGSFHLLTEASPFNANPLNTFRVELQNLTQGDCVKVLMAAPMNDATMGIVQVGITGMATGCTIQNGTQTAGCAFGVTPMLLTTAQTWCVPGNTNEIDFDFKLHN